MDERDTYIETLDRSFSRIGRKMRQRMAQETLTMDQYSLLKLLSDLGSMTVSDVADQLGLSLASASAMIDRLANQKFIDRFRQDSDRRVVLVQLSSLGCIQIAELQKQRREFLDHLFSRMTESDLKTLVTLIEKIEESSEPDE